MIFGVILGLALMGGMIFMALNRNSPFSVRLASLIALAVMFLTIIICVIIIFSNDTVVVDESVVNIGSQPAAEESGGSDIFVIALIVLVLLGLFAVLVYQALKERKNTGIQNKPGSLW